MASPNSTYDEIATTTLEHRGKELADNVGESIGIVLAMKESGNIKKFSGGETIVEEIAYAANSTVKSYSGYEELDITPQNVLSAFEFGIKQKAVAVSMSGLEMLQNAGPEQMIDLLDARIENAEISAKNAMAEGMYSDGTADSSKEITGLQAHVADSPSSGTIGGISRSTYTWARNISYSGVTNGGAAVSASNIRKYMQRLYVQLCRGNEKPNVILADNNYYSFFEDSLMAIQTVTNTSDNAYARAGFETLKWKGVPVVLDGGYGGACPSNHMYMLNTKYLKYRPHSQRDWVPLKPDRHSTNQDAMIKLLAWAGQVTGRCYFLQGVLVA